MKHFFSLFILFFCLNANSHEFNPAHLIINQSNSNLNKYDATWMYPVKNIGKRANVIFPDICEPMGSDPFIQGKYIIEKIILKCNESIKGKNIEIENLFLGLKKLKLLFLVHFLLCNLHFQTGDILATENRFLI